MALEGPRLIYTRKEEEDSSDVVTKSLQLARQLEDLLGETSQGSGRDIGSGHDLKVAHAHSTRIVRAMAASLVDELEAIVRGNRKAGLS